MQKFQSFQPGGFWLVTLAAALWGTIGVATQAVYFHDNTTSLFINLMRMLVATPILSVACWRVVGATMFNIQRRDLLIMMLSGVLLAISQAAYFAAIRYTGVTIATLLTICTAPLFVTCVSLLLKFETLSSRIVTALICAIIGSILLVGLHSPEGTSYNLLLGAVFSLISAIGYGGMIICGRFLAGTYHPLQITTVSFGAGTLALIGINLLAGFVSVHTPQSWLLLMYLGLVPTALAYWLFQVGLRSVSAMAASILSLLEGMVAALLAWLLFGEKLAATGIIGAVLLILSILLLSSAKTRPNPQ